MRSDSKKIAVVHGNTVTHIIFMEQVWLFNTLDMTTEVLHRTSALLESKSYRDTENKARFLQQRIWF